MIFLLIFTALVIAVAAYILIRSELAYKEFLYNLDLIDEYSTADIEAGRPWDWRFEVFEDITFYTMVFSFKPIKSFFRGREEIRP